MSIDIRKDHRAQISQKIQKRKVLEELVLLQIDYKNNYSLSLILDIVENICTKKVFIKLNL